MLAYSSSFANLPGITSETSRWQIKPMNTITVLLNVLFEQVYRRIAKVQLTVPIIRHIDGIVVTACLERCSAKREVRKKRREESKQKKQKEEKEKEEGPKKQKQQWIKEITPWESDGASLKRKKCAMQLSYRRMVNVKNQLYRDQNVIKLLHGEILYAIRHGWPERREGTNKIGNSTTKSKHYVHIQDCIAKALEKETKILQK